MANQLEIPLRVSQAQLLKMRKRMSKRGHDGFFAAFFEDGEMLTELKSEERYSDEISHLDQAKGFRYVLYAPPGLSIIHFPIVTTLFFAALRRAFASNQEIKMSFELCRYISPECMAILNALLDKAELPERKFIFPPISKSQSANFKVNISRKHRHHVYKIDDSGQKYEYRVVTTNNAYYQSRDRIPKYIYRSLERIEDTFLKNARFTDTELHSLNTAYIEASLNVDQHAYPASSNTPPGSKSRLWTYICETEPHNQAYIDFSSATGVFDFGITIAGSFRENHWVEPPKLKDLVLERSSSTGLPNRGYGFQDFFDVARFNDDFRFVCVSGFEYIWFDDDGSYMYRQLPQSFDGTVVVFYKAV